MIPPRRGGVGLRRFTGRLRGVVGFLADVEPDRLSATKGRLPRVVFFI